MKARASKLDNFLEAYRVKKTDPEPKPVITHTTFGKKLGSYAIPEDKYEMLYDLIIETTCKNKEQTTIVERPIFDGEKCVKIFTVDIDFRYSFEYPKRQHKIGHIQAIVNLFNMAMRKYLTLPDGCSIKSIISERSGPYKDNGNFKDGIHIIFPDIGINTKAQLLIRKEVLQNFVSDVLSNDALGHLPVKNDPADIVDRSVIEQNGWIMHSCSKQGLEPYEITHVLLHKYLSESESFILAECKNEMTDAELIRYLSVQKKPVFEGVIMDEHRHLLAEFNGKKKIKINQALSEDEEKLLQIGGKALTSAAVVLSVKDQCKQTEEVKELIELLSLRRAHDYHSWLEVGWCLFNINNGLLSVWRDFSKKSNKYKKGDCDKWWSNFDKRNLTIGSLHLWASIDSPDEYREVKSRFLSSYIQISLTMTTYDVGMVLFQMYKHRFVCADVKNNIWYEFKEHRWHEYLNCTAVKNKISTEMLKEYIKLGEYYYSVAYKATEDDKRDDALNKVKQISELTFKLRDSTFKNKIIEEAKGLFINEAFIPELDSNPKLLGFNNGIYDLSSQIFRDGRPEDMIKMTTGLDFPDREFDEDDETMQELLAFLGQIYPNADTRGYALKMFASFLDGTNPNEEFYVFTGGGGNGKSKLIELFDSVLGDYSGKVPVSFLTQKRASSAAANPEISRLVGKRFACFQEPGNGEKLNIGIMKEMTGGDKIMVRSLFKMPFETKLQTKYALCCNHLPIIDSNDEGTWRRLRVLEHISKFVDNPSGPNEFKKDRLLSQKMVSWKEAFMTLLVRYYSIYIRDGLVPPIAVAHATSEYKKDSDLFSQFRDDALLRNEADFIKLDDTYDCFKVWFANGAITGKVPNKRDFKKEIDSCLGVKYLTKGAKSGWYGWSIKTEECLI
jgi:P4 family phage/plasmid primase-like protien